MRVLKVFGLYKTINRIPLEHAYDACPIYSELKIFRIIAYLYVSDGSRRPAVDSAKVQNYFFYI